MMHSTFHKIYDILCATSRIILTVRKKLFSVWFVTVPVYCTVRIILSDYRGDIVKKAHMQLHTVCAV